MKINILLLNSNFPYIIVRVQRNENFKIQYIMCIYATKAASFMNSLRFFLNLIFLFKIKLKKIKLFLKVVNE